MEETRKTGEGESAVEGKGAGENKGGSGINHSHFAILYVILTVAVVGLVFKFFNPETGPAYGSAIRIGASSMQTVALWFVSALGFTAALNGLNCNVYKEIVDEHNTALAILVGFGWLAIAIAIHG